MTRKGAKPNGSNAKNDSNVEPRSPREKTPTGPSALDPEREDGSGPNETSEDTFEDEGTERPGILTRSQKAAIRNLRTKGWSTDRIHKTTGVAKSTIFKYTKEIVPSGVDDSEQTASIPTLDNIEAMRLLRRSGADPSTIRKLTGWPLEVVNQHIADVTPEQQAPPAQQSIASPPKLQSEVVTDTPPPRIIEENNGHEEQTRPQVLVENYSGSSTAPVRVVVDPNSPYLQELLVQLLHLSAARNVPFKKYLETGMAVEDLRNASFAATLVPGETSEEFRRNLLSIAKKANFHDRYRTDAGLDGGVEQR